MATEALRCPRCGYDIIVIDGVRWSYRWYPTNLKRSKSCTFNAATRAASGRFGSTRECGRKTMAEMIREDLETPTEGEWEKGYDSALRFVLHRVFSDMQMPPKEEP